MMPKSKLIPVALIMSLFAAVLTYQNCSPVNFEVSEASKTNRPTGDGDPVDEPETGTPKICVDTEHGTRQDGETWTTETTNSIPVACANAPSQIQKTLTKNLMMCENTKIKLLATNTMPSGEIPQCPLPILSVFATPASLLEGSTAQLHIATQYVETVSYNCRSTVDSAPPQSVKSGTAEPGKTDLIPVPVATDLKCQVEAVNATGVKRVAEVDIPVNCGNKIKSGGRCVEFNCVRIEPLAQNGSGVLQIPARTAEGVCYSVKLIDAQKSQLSVGIGLGVDPDIVSRNHDNSIFNNPNLTRHPYKLGDAVMDFRIGGPRQIKLSGASVSLAPIRVDNFVVTGIYPKSNAVPEARHYQVSGTSDSSIYDTGSILFKNVHIPIKSFGTGGTASVAPVDITGQVSPQIDYTIDVRARDCGASGAMSDLYLLFQ